jgi:hypothetical protein
MISSLIRAFRGPSRDPRMASISRPLPRGLHDEQVVAALEIALRENPDPAYLVETLRPALLTVAGRDYEVLDRSVRDVTGTFAKPMVMIRDGEVGLWPGYRARAYPLRQPPADGGQPNAAGAPGPQDGRPARKPGWEPPAPLGTVASGRPPPGPEGD